MQTTRALTRKVFLESHYLISALQHNSIMRLWKKYCQNMLISAANETDFFIT